MDRPNDHGGFALSHNLFSIHNHSLMPQLMTFRSVVWFSREWVWFI